MLIFCTCGCGQQLDDYDKWHPKRKKQYIKGHNRKGKHHSEISKERNAKSKRGSIQSIESNIKRSQKQRGEKCYNWKGGITPLTKIIRECYKSVEWRTQVFGRDNFTCQKCGVRGSWLEAHHIKSFSSIIKEHNIKNLEDSIKCNELWDLNNGITLCKECHSKTNNYKGRGK